MAEKQSYYTISEIWIYIIISILVGSMSACSIQFQTPSLSTTPNPTSTSKPTLKPTNSPTPTITPSQTATATYTATPSPTMVLTDTPTFTPTSTPQFVSVIAENAQVYSGPGAAYDLLAIYTQDIKVHAVGRHENNAWVIVLLPDKQGWVSVDKVVVDFEIDTLPMFDIPPTPLPSLTPTPSPSVRFYTSEEENYFVKEQLNIIIENVIPFEPLKIDVYFPDGEYRTYKSVTTNSQGNYKEIFRRSFWSKLPDGTYKVVVTGEYGSKVTGSFTLPLDK